MFIILPVIFIRFAPTTAANFTDNVLRPIIGSRTVLFLEKQYFNGADSAQRALYSKRAPSSPVTDSSSTLARGGNLELKAVPITHSFPLLTHEGQWLTKPLALFPHEEKAAYTIVRPDPSRSFAIVTVVQFDLRGIRLATVAGTKQPGGPIGNPGPGTIPSDIIARGALVAAFDGGFQYRDGTYGMIVGKTTYLPLVRNIGTLVGYNDGSLRIIDYTGQSLGNDVAFVRQNCPLLVENGRVAVSDEKNKALWGRTFSSDIVTWRSGIGLTANGNLLYAVGNNLTPETLARALQLAGAVSALQLDINPNWVRFNFFTPSANGTYSSSTLIKALKDGSKEYLNGFSKDFFYLYKP